MIKLLTEAEAAKLLRCTRSKIKQLVLEGKLPHLPGPPVLIDEADLEAYVQNEKRIVPGSGGLTKAQYDEACKRARQICLTRQFRINARKFTPPK